MFGKQRRKVMVNSREYCGGSGGGKNDGCSFNASCGTICGADDGKYIRQLW